MLRDFGRLTAQVDAVCALADQFLENRMNGIEAVGDASIVKNAYSRALRAYARLGVRLGGMAAAIPRIRSPLAISTPATGWPIS